MLVWPWITPIMVGPQALQYSQLEPYVYAYPYLTHIQIWEASDGMEVSDEGDFLLAIDRYTAAITLNRNNHVLFSNRSAAYARVGKFAEALEDAKRCHELKPDWPKVCVWDL